MAPQDLHLSGVIYDAQGGPSMPIAGARVAALLCVPRAFSAVADQAGRYALFVPASYANVCSQLTLEVSAPGIHPLQPILRCERPVAPSSARFRRAAGAEWQ